jgi:hypothetical protein
MQKLYLPIVYFIWKKVFINKSSRSNQKQKEIIIRKINLKNNNNNNKQQFLESEFDYFNLKQELVIYLKAQV